MKTFKKFLTVESPNLTSKMWIMSNGTVYPTKNLWHYAWALQNKKTLEKHGIDFSNISEKDGEQKVRIELIKQGMFRVNHLARGNQLIVEGLKKYFNRRVKDSLLDLIMENSGSVANLSITLFDENVKRIVFDKSANFFGVIGSKEQIDRAYSLIYENKSISIEDFGSSKDGINQIKK